MSKNILRERIYSACLDVFCCDAECPPQKLPQLTEDIAILTKFWHTMHSDKKYLMTSSIGGRWFTAARVRKYVQCHSLHLSVVDFDVQSTYDNQMTVSSITELRGTGSTVGSSSSSAVTHGWINTVPLSATSTLSKRTLLSNKQQVKNNDSYVKDYIRKRNLILDLLVSIKFR